MSYISGHFKKRFKEEKQPRKESYLFDVGQLNVVSHLDGSTRSTTFRAILEEDNLGRLLLCEWKQVGINHSVKK